ncbi:hypothetical protein [Kitasatospora sp. NPDC086791]|uniref:hypothetical protein n=1 Tax=Kitasatospora sp. NPDC086791 TaxID=3155178 RepID=UPI00343E2CBC
MSWVSGDHLRRRRHHSLIAPGLRAPLLVLAGASSTVGSLIAVDHLLHGTTRTVAQGLIPAGFFCLTMAVAVAFRRYFTA